MTISFLVNLLFEQFQFRHCHLLNREQFASLGCAISENLCAFVLKVTALLAVCVVCVCVFCYIATCDCRLVPVSEKSIRISVWIPIVL